MFRRTAVGGDVVHLATVVDESAIAAVHAWVLRRLLQSFMHRGLLAEDDGQAMVQWTHAGVFVIDGSVRI